MEARRALEYWRPRDNARFLLRPPTDAHLWFIDALRLLCVLWSSAFAVMLCIGYFQSRTQAMVLHAAAGSSLAAFAVNGHFAADVMLVVASYAHTRRVVRRWGGGGGGGGGDDGAAAAVGFVSGRDVVTVFRRFVRRKVTRLLPLTALVVAAAAAAPSPGPGVGCGAAGGLGALVFGASLAPLGAQCAAWLVWPLSVYVQFAAGSTLALAAIAAGARRWRRTSFRAMSVGFALLLLLGVVGGTIAVVRTLVVPSLSYEAAALGGAYYQGFFTSTLGRSPAAIWGAVFGLGAPPAGAVLPSRLSTRERIRAGGLVAVLACFVLTDTTVMLSWFPLQWLFVSLHRTAFSFGVAWVVHIACGSGYFAALAARLRRFSALLALGRLSLAFHAVNFPVTYGVLRLVADPAASVGMCLGYTLLCLLASYVLAAFLCLGVEVPCYRYLNGLSSTSGEDEVDPFDDAESAFIPLSVTDGMPLGMDGQSSSGEDEEDHAAGADGGGGGAGGSTLRAAGGGARAETGDGYGGDRSVSEDESGAAAAAVPRAKRKAAARAAEHIIRQLGGRARASDMEFVVEAALMIAERAGEDDEFAQYVVTIVIDEAGVST